MLRTDLINLINHGNMWAFVGSGVSIDSGYPSWKGLVERCVAGLEASLRSSIEADRLYTSYLGTQLYEKCLGRIEDFTGRSKLEQFVASQFMSDHGTGKLANLLADWPFAGYITTNYDGVLERALKTRGALGWSSVANTREEVRKLAGDPTNVIWHIHGYAGFGLEKSRLILTEKDYDDLYLEGSPVVTQLRGLLGQRRIVFIGFGFKDHEIVRLIKIVSRLSNPARPAYAFLANIYGTEFEPERKDLLSRSNVDVIPYRLRDGSHRDLVELIETFNSMILRRSQRFNQPAATVPSFDPETTGLLVYNTLALKGESQLTEDVLGKLLRARILSILKCSGAQSLESLHNDLRERVAQVRRQPPTTLTYLEEITRVLEALGREQIVQIIDRGDSKIISLTPKGVEMVATQAATSERLYEQFSASIMTRAGAKYPDDHEAANRISKAIESFLKDAISRRALGVAMIWYAPGPYEMSYHMVALLQSLPEFIGQLRAPDEARALVELVQEILAHPSPAELQYLGLLLQAQFGVHLLGYDPETLRVRAGELASTLFVIDSSTLIPYFARSSVGYYSARLLIDKLRAVGARIATTKMLTDEVAEHAQWPIVSKVVSDTGYVTVETAKAATGTTGYKENAFLEGFLTEGVRGTTVLNYLTYLDSICNCGAGLGASDDAWLEIIGHELEVIKFGEWKGFNQEEYEERDGIQEKIAKTRRTSGTYKHDRQVRAEAEALIVIRDARTSTLKLDTKAFTNAYFASKTRAIDQVSGVGLPVTMRPEAILQWLSTVTYAPVEELGYLINGLLWELSERNVAIVDKQRLQIVFSPLIAASKEQLPLELSKHKSLISNRFGESAERAFRETSALNLPIMMQSYLVQKAEELEKALDAEKQRRERAEMRATITEVERGELERLRAEKKFRKQKAQRRKRASASRPKKKK